MNDTTICSCGKKKEPDKKSCYECYQEWRKNKENGQSKKGANTDLYSNKSTSSTAQPAELPPGYLAAGYFEAKNGKNYLREELFTDWAKQISRALQSKKMSSTATRRFFNKLRAVEYEFKMQRDFDRVREKIFAFARDVAYTENRGVTPALFTRFIDMNITLAKKDPEHLRGFIEHFQSVIAYFPKD